MTSTSTSKRNLRIYKLIFNFKSVILYEKTKLARNEILNKM